MPVDRSIGDYRWLWVLVVLYNCVGVSMAQNCKSDGPSVEVVAVASVLGTLAVVILALGITYFVLRRRNGGFLFPPKRTRKSIVAAGEDGDPRNLRDSCCYDNPAFSGRDSAVDLEEGFGDRHSSAGRKSPMKDNQKTWASLPPQQDFPEGLHRKGSCGSFDNSYVDPETVSVWLQSQDIIGLGFNISGNMRDGIFVSQVHNRGPAVQSGKIKVGDRITSVTIAYDNIVYEDALTILSYASPYPVKITLQKERVVGRDSRQSSTSQLNHPLYRSQSMDALQRITRDPPSKPKRTHSEVKAASPNRKSKSLSQSQVPDESVLVQSDALVHVASAPDDETNEVLATTLVMEGKKNKLDTDTAREFANLMDQTAERPNTSPKTPPNKPERKSKPGSYGGNSDEFPKDEKNVEEVFEATKSVQAQSAPPKKEEDLGPEAEEEEIKPAHVKREININMDRFEFPAVERPEKAVERPPSPNRFTYVKRKPRSESPEREAVEEESIAAAVAPKANMAALPPRPSKSPEGEKEGEGECNDFPASDGDVKDDVKTEAEQDSTPSDSQKAAEEQNPEEHSENDNNNNNDSENCDSVSPQDHVSERSDMTSEVSNYKSEPDNKLTNNHLPDDADDDSENKENRDDSLDWSGKRLVRSGSFSEIPQDDSVSDWTDRNMHNDDDSNSVTSGKRSSVDTNMDSDPEIDSSRSMPSRDIFKARENLANLSDLSNSISSSRSSSPVHMNGPTDGGLNSQSPGSMKIATITPDNNANSKTTAVTLNASTEDDVEC